MMTELRVVVGKGQDSISVQSERVARMIAFLATQQQRLEAIDKGSLVFDFAGSRGLTYKISHGGDLSNAT
jgi:hypothetical protein